MSLSIWVLPENVLNDVGERKEDCEDASPRERGAEEGAGAEGSQAGLLRIPPQSDREQRHQATPFPVQALCKMSQEEAGEQRVPRV